MTISKSPLSTNSPTSSTIEVKSFYPASLKVHTAFPKRLVANKFTNRLKNPVMAQLDPNFEVKISQGPPPRGPK